MPISADITEMMTQAMSKLTKIIKTGPKIAVSRPSAASSFAS